MRCCLRAGKPPQLWRWAGAIRRGLAHLDALICPSRSTRDEHARRGISRETVHLPYFLPHDYTGLPAVATPRYARPYVAMGGRLEKVKGYQDAIAAIRHVPALDLRIAGSGAYESDLRRAASNVSNVHFEGRLDPAQLAALFRGACAVVVPSLVHETFGYVVLEAFAEGTPVITRNLGALPELVGESGGGLLFEDLAGLVNAIQRLAFQPALRRVLGRNGQRARYRLWSEAGHLERYFDLIARHRGSVPGHGSPRRMMPGTGQRRRIAS
jgi:glycosyltransferase involved in cell wall biosynthesis